MTGPAVQIRVPIDDTHTAHWWFMTHDKDANEPEQRFEDIPFFSPPVIELNEAGEPRWEFLIATPLRTLPRG